MISRFYARAILPRLCDFALDSPLVEKHRRKLLSAARGEILEIGLGTGLNLPHYPDSVRKVTAVDPNPGMYRRAEERIKQAAFDIEIRILSGEELPFDHGAFDCVVSTFTLCSIDDVGGTLREIHRVLKPIGQFLFLEHGLSPDPKVQKWQRRLNPLQRLLAGNCRLDRRMSELVRAQAFECVEVDEFYLERIPRTHGYIYRGAARK